jgi:hypothetical protein
MLACIHYCSGKSVTITYSEYVFVCLGTLHACCMRHIIVCGLSGSTTFFDIISKGTIFEKIYNIFRHYLKRHDFRKELLSLKRVF